MRKRPSTDGAPCYPCYVKWGIAQYNQVDLSRIRIIRKVEMKRCIEHFELLCQVLFKSSRYGTHAFSHVQQTKSLMKDLHIVTSRWKSAMPLMVKRLQREEGRRSGCEDIVLWWIVLMSAWRYRLTSGIVTKPSSPLTLSHFSLLSKNLSQHHSITWSPSAKLNGTW